MGKTYVLGGETRTYTGPIAVQISTDGNGMGSATLSGIETGIAYAVTETAKTGYSQVAVTGSAGTIAMVPSSPVSPTPPPAALRWPRCGTTPRIPAVGER